MSRTIRSFLAIGALLGACTASFAQTLPAASWEARLKIRVRVFSNVQLPRQDLAEAEQQASTPLYTAGVEILWLDCCRPSLRAHEPSGSIVLRDLKHLAARMLAWAEGVPRGLSLGIRFSPLPAGDKRSPWAGVLYHYVRGTTEGGDIPWYWTLARAVVEQTGDPQSSTPRLTKGPIRLQWLREDPEWVV